MVELLFLDHGSFRGFYGAVESSLVNMCDGNRSEGVEQPRGVGPVLAGGTIKCG